MYIRIYVLLCLLAVCIPHGGNSCFSLCRKRHPSLRALSQQERRGSRGKAKGRQQSEAGLEGLCGTWGGAPGFHETRGRKSIIVGDVKKKTEPLPSGTGNSQHHRGQPIEGAHEMMCLPIREYFNARTSSFSSCSSMSSCGVAVSSANSATAGEAMLLF